MRREEGPAWLPPRRRGVGRRTRANQVRVGGGGSARRPGGRGWKGLKRRGLRARSAGCIAGWTTVMYGGLGGLHRSTERCTSATSSSRWQRLLFFPTGLLFRPFVPICPCASFSRLPFFFHLRHVSFCSLQSGFSRRRAPSRAPGARPPRASPGGGIFGGPFPPPARCHLGVLPRLFAAPSPRPRGCIDAWNSVARPEGRRDWSWSRSENQARARICIVDRPIIIIFFFFDLVLVLTLFFLFASVLCSFVYDS